MEEWIKLAEKNGINRKLFHRRVKRQSWPPEKAATMPTNRHSNRPDYQFILAAESNGIPKKQYIKRIIQGWSPAAASTIPTDRVKRRPDYKYIVMAEKNGISKKLYNRRLGQGWSKRDAAARKVINPSEITREDKEWIELARKNGINYYTYWSRVDNGWSPEEAATKPALKDGQAIRKAQEVLSEKRRNLYDKLNSDPENLFELTPELFKVAEKNGLKKVTVKSRVQKQGWTVQEAVSTPLQETNASKDGYKEFVNLALRNGISREIFKARLRYGWDFHKAATEPIRKKQPRTRPDKEWIDLAVNNGINYYTYWSRVDRGWTPKEAATIPALEKGQFLNEEREENSKKAYKNFRMLSRKGKSS
ncbi:hypothetical protein CHH69_18040 [Terribacillus saccharophilus]|uniref:hypothetical protein n=1 Tax=Terribacillus saccharophilus TaxID=361277 RepID=UPI000BA6E8E1|nr:hypothetical protein [Terribacillus saccharophilus]PAF34025.1 hypothetical protein CHH69_18040 [Terribacillus saccharophilus]